MWTDGEFAHLCWCSYCCWRLNCSLASSGQTLKYAIWIFLIFAFTQHTGGTVFLTRHQSHLMLKYMLVLCCIQLYNIRPVFGCWNLTTFDVTTAHYAPQFAQFSWMSYINYFFGFFLLKFSNLATIHAVSSDHISYEHVHILLVSVTKCMHLHVVHHLKRVCCEGSYICITASAVAATTSGVGCRWRVV